MLTESFVVATCDPEKATNKTSAGIHFHQLQPVTKLDLTFKKSSINPNGLAITRTHVLAAQANKGVINVYSRERKNQETIVPFPEKIRSIAIAGVKEGTGNLILGTESGAITVWQLCSGRQVTTPKHHLKVITCLAVDAKSHFFLSGSEDSNLHLWNLGTLFAFPNRQSRFEDDTSRSPVRTLTLHKDAITNVRFGNTGLHNVIAVSIARDNLCIVWDPHSGAALHTYLLHATPLCLSLDPADRAVYVGISDGSIQLINFFKNPSLEHPLYSSSNASAIASTQADPNDKWSSPETTSATLSLDVSFDGTLILTGHESGAINLWTIAGGRLAQNIAILDAPVTNLQFLFPTGFPNETEPPTKIINVTKPLYNDDADSKGLLPSLTYNVQFTNTQTPIKFPGEESIFPVSFMEAFEHDCLPPSMIEEFLAEEERVLRGEGAGDTTEDLETENKALAQDLEAERQTVSELQRRIARRERLDEMKEERKRKRRVRMMKIKEWERKVAMREAKGEKETGAGEEEEEEEIEDEEPLSSDTDDLTEG